MAVADVDAAVARDTPRDAHARLNTTSVYTAARTFPMLPERLSADRTSLVEGEDRITVVAAFEVDGEGRIGATDLFEARVRNHARLVYETIAAWLEGLGPAPAEVAASAELAAQLRRQDEAARRLRARRHERGALPLETIEARPVVRDGRVVELRPQEKDRARQLIEDFMIAANEATARFLQDRGVPSLRRVVRTPERWSRLEALAAGKGVTLPTEPDAGALADFLRRMRAADPLRFPDLSLAVVKLLGAGEYVVHEPGTEGAGHFGLAVRDYTHSTAPNRRYPDLVTQRLVKALLAGAPPPYARDELEALARHCTRQEDAANRVERQVKKAASALLLDHIARPRRAGRAPPPRRPVRTPARPWTAASSPASRARRRRRRAVRSCAPTPREARSTARDERAKGDDEPDSQSFRTTPARARLPLRVIGACLNFLWSMVRLFASRARRRGVHGRRPAGLLFYARMFRSAPRTGSSAWR